MMITTLRVSACLLSCLVILGACGSDQTDRTATGAGGGALTGMAAGAVLGPVGMAVGAGVGALIGGGTGYATDEEDIDLGEPVWKDDEGVDDEMEGEDAQ